MRQMPQKDLLALARWNTPTIFNGWEAVTTRSSTDKVFNREELTDFMPEFGPRVGYAVTVAVEPSNPDHREANPDAWTEYRRYVASVPGPKIVVVQDLDKPELLGAFWGEVNSNVHLTLGCVASVTDGGVRDLDEMRAAGFKTLARRLCVGHAYVHPVRWNVPVEAFGCPIRPGQVIHADQHGFMAIPDEDLDGLLHATEFMDRHEFASLIVTAKDWRGRDADGFLTAFDDSSAEFATAAATEFGKTGEF